ncbi:MAG: methyltransferase type 11, partial [Caulobacteraceae bacterium]|nr:methyltransferase type 11 [Caulobacter sp.]
MKLRSPVSGQPLAPEGPHALSDGAGERWPVVDGVPYLRAGSRALADAALERLDGGDREGALALLLAENDAWWDEPPPPEAALRAVVREADALSLREVMRRLGWGRVGDYFAHRWTDPTFVAGLALTDAHWTAPSTAFELACGVGGHLRALAAAGVRVAGGDVVFAKLWV